MILNEIVKNFLLQPEPQSDKESSTVTQDNTLMDMSNNDLYPNTGSFFDSENNSGLFDNVKNSDIIQKQKEKIMKYRQLSMTPDVNDALDEIVNEVIFTYDDASPLQIEINEENEKLVDAITGSFNKITKLANVKRNLFQMVKRSYIDGQAIIHCAYDKKNTKGGIKSVKLIEPSMLFYDTKNNTYKYMLEDKVLMHNVQDVNKEYSIEEIVREDFGLYDGQINLGYLEYALKPANILKTLEDLLIPMRFSRSISRRIFNVDIGDLPSKRGAEVMRDYQNKFKYKKFYNAEDGTVTNQQHITSMVEDYWFANRSGGKGTQVDLLDETGNLGELDDILYFNKKLYRSLKIPSSRININPEADHEFDYESTRVSKEDMKFFMFISRVRQVYSSIFKEIVKRDIISTGVMTEAEWEEREEEIMIYFAHENKFIEKMKLDNFMNKLEIYATAAEYQGKLFPVEKILKDVFRMDDEEIEDNFKRIQTEEKNELYAKFYQGGEEENPRW